MLRAPRGGVVSEPLEDDAVERLRRLDQALDHDEPVAAADRLRMHRQVEDAARRMLVRPHELAVPDLVDGRRRVLADGSARHELEVLEIGEAPAEGDPHEVDALAEHVRAVGRETVAAAQVVRLEVGPRERGVVDKALLD